MSAGADAFYADAGYEHAGEDDFEPQVVEDLSRAELDQHAREIYGLDSWADVEQHWAEADAQQAAEAQAREYEQLSAMYGDQRLGQLTGGRSRRQGARRSTSRLCRTPPRACSATSSGSATTTPSAESP
jgi:hypothetical protein